MRSPLRMEEPTEPETLPIGAYGLRLEGLEAAAHLLRPAPSHWTGLHVDWSVGPQSPGPDRVGDDQALVRFSGGLGWLSADRPSALISYTFSKQTQGSEIVHPFLPVGASIWARWLGREAFHAGAVVVDGGAWAIMGGKQSGKSSTLAWLAMHGFPVLTDDVLVLDDGMALAGPPFVDLRRDAAESLSLGRNIGVVGLRERWRVQTGHCPVEVPLRGWVHLAWGDRVEIMPLTAQSRLAALFQHRIPMLPPRDPVRYMSLAALPGWRLTRPKGLANLDAATEVLLEAVSGRSRAA